MGIKTTVIDENEAALATVERYCIDALGLKPRAALVRAFRQRAVFVNGAPAKRTQAVHAGDRLEIRSESVYAASQAYVIPNADLPLTVLLETKDAIVIAKPSGQHAHPHHPNEIDTAVNAVVARYPEVASVQTGMQPGRQSDTNSARPLEGGLVHRLDQGTSGILVFARSQAAWNEIKSAWRNKSTEKVYVALVRGHLRKAQSITLNLAHDPRDRRRMVVVGPVASTATPEIPRSANTSAGRSRPAPQPAPFKQWRAHSSIFPVEYRADENATLVLVQITTGVTHQIRVTLGALGHPILGDGLYGPPRSPAATVVPHPTRPAPSVPGADATRARPTVAVHESFALHALWLRVPDVTGLRDGVWCDPPSSWGVALKPELLVPAAATLKASSNNLQ